MIISASRRTDLPAFYAPWLKERFQAGWCLVANPFNPRQVTRLSLKREDVEAIVFWTRHARPLFSTLEWLLLKSYRFYFQYTITGYGRPVEARTPSVERASSTFRDLARRLPFGAVVWRYDPILLGPAFPLLEHLQRFGAIAQRLEGATKRVVVSFVDLYRKTTRRLQPLFPVGREVAGAQRHAPQVAELLGGLVALAARHGMQMEACAEAGDYRALGVAPTKCVDDRLLRELFGGTWSDAKDRGQRPLCGCIKSRDMGAPGTCCFGCAYCYATASDMGARKRHQDHDPTTPAL